LGIREGCRKEYFLSQFEVAHLSVIRIECADKNPSAMLKSGGRDIGDKKEKTELKVGVKEMEI
jgi:hypothetical protein